MLAPVPFANGVLSCDFTFGVLIGGFTFGVWLMVLLLGCMVNLFCGFTFWVLFSCFCVGFLCCLISLFAFGLICDFIFEVFDLLFYLWGLFFWKNHGHEKGGFDPLKVLVAAIVLQLRWSANVS